MNRKLCYSLLILLLTGFSFSAIISWRDKAPGPAEIQVAAVKGFSILQSAGATFIAKSKCSACHHSTMTSMIAGTLRRKGVTGFDTTATLREMAMKGTLDYVGNPNMNSQFVSAKFLAPYVLLGLAAENHPADFTTDIAVDYILSQATQDGSFKAEYARVPLECGDIHLTALSVRAISLYASPAKKTQVQQLTRLTRQWLEKQRSDMQQEVVFQLLGMHWCGSSEQAKVAIAKKLLAMQNKDGGWSQLPSMKSDAYATGQALYALAQSGYAGSNNDSWQKGISYLLRTQDKTGAWIVNTRSNPIQLFVNSEFPPYDDNQFISAAASNWAVLALAEALPDAPVK